MNIILKNQIESFCEDHLFKELDDPEKLEHFANYYIISQYYPTLFSDLEDVNCDGEGDLGIDGIGVLVNDKVISSIEELKGILEMDKKIDVQFVLTQIKSSNSFRSDTLGTFMSGVFTIFNNIEKDSNASFNEKIRDKLDIIKEIYKNSTNFTNNPRLHMYYVTTGEWKEPKEILQRADMEKERLEKLQIFDDINNYFYGSKELQGAYKENTGNVEKELPAHKYMDLPEREGITQSFVCLISLKEYINLIKDEKEKINKNLFLDNVRDYQGMNRVNNNIKKTLNNENRKSLLHLLHNGITIIAKNVHQTGSKFKISNFQIVNGCQTSHVIFNESRNIDGIDDVYIIVKVIKTNNPDIANDIIMATNSQTEVKSEAFESIRLIHRRLEQYFEAQSNQSTFKIYYERRSKQFIDSTIRSHQIVSLSYLTKACFAVKLGQPQGTHRYFGEIIQSNKSLFDENDEKDSDLFIYYVSAFLLKNIDMYFHKNQKNWAKKFKYHIAFIIFEKWKLDNKINKKNPNLQGIIGNMDFYIVNSIQLISKVKKRFLRNDRGLDRNKAFTEKIKEQLKNFEFR